MNKKLKLAVSSFMLSLLFLFTFPALSSSNQGDLKNFNMLTLSQIPYGFVTPDGNTTGVLYEILNHVMALSGVGKSNDIIPFKRVLARINAKQQFCTIAANTPLSANVFDLVEPIGYQISAGILPAKGINLINYSNLKNLKIDTTLGAYIDERFNNDDSLKKVISSKYENAMKMLINGRVDAVAGAIPALAYIAKRQGLDQNSFGNPLVYDPYDLFLVCSYDIPADIRSKLKSALVNLKASGKVQKRLKKLS